MGLKKFEIIFDVPQATYYAGQTLSGRVLVHLDAPKRIRGVRLKIQGEAEVHWTERKSRRNADGKSSTVTVHYRGSESYFENKYYTIGSADDDMELPAGRHEYPFQYHLPSGLPSSFEGEYGYVRYTVKATLDRPWKFDQETKVAFTVVTPLDLNLMPEVKEPRQVEQRRTFCCASGQIDLTISVPATGFVPGQIIPVTVDLENNSSTKVHNVKGALRKVVTWHVTSPHSKQRTTKANIAELSVGEEILPGGSKTYSKNIQIPSLPPSNLRNCGIIDLEYFFKIEAVLGFFHANLSAKLPIVVGTIPLLTGPTAFVPGNVSKIEPQAPADSDEWIDVDGNDDHSGSESGSESHLDAKKPPPYPTPAPYPTPGPYPAPAYPVPAPYPTPAPAPYPAPFPAPPSSSAGWNVPAVPPAGYPPGYAPAPTAPGPQAPGGSNGPTGQFAPSAPPLYPDLPPPSYEECMFGGNNIRDDNDNSHTMGMTDFFPRYPVWTFHQ